MCNGCLYRLCGKCIMGVGNPKEPPSVCDWWRTADIMGRRPSSMDMIFKKHDAQGGVAMGIR